MNDCSPQDIARTLYIVPLAEVRILAIDTESKVVADARTEIGVSSRVAALFSAVVAVIVGFVILSIGACLRLKGTSVADANWFLRIISTPGGVASLSQFQILLWTFVVAASAIYVMAISGDLIAITSGTLVLLGIAGVSVVASKADGEARAANAEAHAATAESAANKAAAEHTEAKNDAASWEYHAEVATKAGVSQFRKLPIGERES